LISRESSSAPKSREVFRRRCKGRDVLGGLEKGMEKFLIIFAKKGNKK
jgi:hypothetical protein